MVKKNTDMQVYNESKQATKKKSFSLLLKNYCGF